MLPGMARFRLAPLVAVGLLGGAALAVPWGSAWLRDQRLARAAPLLDPEMRRHLVWDSERQWRSYGLKAGTEVLSSVVLALAPGAHSKDFREFRRNREPVEAAQLRVAAVLAEIHDSDVLERRIRNDMGLPARVDHARHQQERRYYELGVDTTLTPEERITELDRIARWFFANGDTGRALFANVPAMYIERDLGHADHYAARLRSAIALARSYQEHYILCQLLGEMGLVHWNADRPDSTQACYDEGIDVAHRHAFPNQAARLLRFYATFYADRGKLTMTLDRHTEAMRLANQRGGEEAQVRALVEYAAFLASLESWDLVERSLRSLPPLLRKLSTPGQAASRVRYEFDSELVRARLALATGRVDEGNRLMRRLTESVPFTNRRVGLAEVFRFWALGLEKANHARQALEICSRGVIHCDSTHVPGHVQIFLVRAARLQAGLGHLDIAEALLDSAHVLEPAPVPGNWSGLRIEGEILQARLHFLRGRTQIARRSIADIYRRFRIHWQDPEGGAMHNLAPVGANALRDAIHEIRQFSPEQGYVFEMEWRSLTGRIPAISPGEAAGLDARDGGVSRSTRLHLSGTHLVYRFTGNALVRWTANAKGIVVDTIPLSAERCLAEVRVALELIESEPVRPGTFLGPRTHDRLSDLSALLLPTSLAASADQPLRLNISPDGPLCALPFEALPFPASKQAPPLALTANVAYLSGLGVSRPNRDGDVVVVSNPRIPDDLAMRYGLTDRLSESDAEARDALHRWPRATLLSGANATKTSIRTRWPRASIIYLAAHHVRDPGAPFLGFVPLTAPPGAPPDASLLESADIRALDLSGCRLAVLASCASGAPYRSAVCPGPGLADAFLDSGAASVVRSFWDVGDVETRDFMRVFLSHWSADQPDAVSLGKARREVMRTPEGSSPRVWAVWSVLTAAMR